MSTPITAEMILGLRNRTDLSMMICKSLLMHFKGDADRAYNYVQNGGRVSSDMHLKLKEPDSAIPGVPDSLLKKILELRLMCRSSIGNAFECYVCANGNMIKAEQLLHERERNLDIAMKSCFREKTENVG